MYLPSLCNSLGWGSVHVVIFSNTRVHQCTYVYVCMHLHSLCAKYRLEHSIDCPAQSADCTSHYVQSADNGSLIGHCTGPTLDGSSIPTLIRCAILLWKRYLQSSLGQAMQLVVLASTAFNYSLAVIYLSSKGTITCHATSHVHTISLANKFRVHYKLPLQWATSKSPILRQSGQWTWLSNRVVRWANGSGEPWGGVAREGKVVNVVPKDEAWSR